MIAAEYSFYGIPAADDPVYDPTEGYMGGPVCLVCRGHSAGHRVRRCDLELARAAEMDDPRFCLRCAKAFDRRSCSGTLAAQGKRDLCGPCQAVPSMWRQLYGPARKPRLIRQGLSAARMQHVRLTNPHLDLRDVSQAELFRLGHDELPDEVEEKP